MLAIVTSPLFAFADEFKLMKFISALGFLLCSLRFVFPGPAATLSLLLRRFEDFRWEFHQAEFPLDILFSSVRPNRVTEGEAPSSVPKSRERLLPAPHSALFPFLSAGEFVAS